MRPQAKDGTVYCVLPVCKPRKTKYSSRPKIDEDGVCNRYLEKDVVPKDMQDCFKSTFHTAVATCLNMKRSIRERVERRFEQTEQRLAALQTQFERIEGKLDQIIQVSQG